MFSCSIQQNKVLCRNLFGYIQSLEMVWISKISIKAFFDKNTVGTMLTYEEVITAEFFTT